MNFLITAGNTQTPIDRVRCITNTFAGRAGAPIARTAWGRGHTVTLVTSNPDALLEYNLNPRAPGERFSVLSYQTFDELTSILQNQLRVSAFDVVCHSAAVSDFLTAGTFTPDSGTFFNARTGEWEARAGAPTLTEQKTGKIRSAEPELWVRLVRAPKLIDRIRHPWGFAGVLVKFELEVGVSEQELVDAAEASRTQSGAEIIVANTLDGAAHWAYIGPIGTRYERVTRRELPDRLVLALEDLYQKRTRDG
ncbi:bifunctional phosphopantothenoylcysteine decarboxylase/phosphopantothenate synthase [Gemmata sp. G18]|uniref:Bifunctional phosphopantothenoylcysteine decarboxylase/phosphopantothenate synthase n=1 Tax=Gemmata palustris TaxID=2822762 RepID=A0ABS5C2Y7_9BACT|nr:phosphopantothenoylcysteine decarboxylase [Gemmata palustris]MBP3960344.1 bifunctional phosphopantothenoylcysteine decarboxylase/phosphopantothenate synthase [Gemmata palustris]